MKIIRSGFELDNGTSGGVSANTFYPQADKPKEEIKKEHERNIDIIERTVNQIKNQLLQ